MDEPQTAVVAGTRNHKPFSIAWNYSIAQPCGTAELGSAHPVLLRDAADFESPDAQASTVTPSGPARKAVLAES